MLTSYSLLLVALALAVSSIALQELHNTTTEPTSIVRRENNINAHHKKLHGLALSPGQKWDERNNLEEDSENKPETKPPALALAPSPGDHEWEMDDEDNNVGHDSIDKHMKKPDSIATSLSTSEMGNMDNKFMEDSSFKNRTKPNSYEPLLSEKIESDYENDFLMNDTEHQHIAKPHHAPIPHNIIN